MAAKASPSLRLLEKSGPREGAGSHLGGEPLLPDGFEWPRWRGKPMSFIAQIKLADLGEHAAAFGLPLDGLLTFFYDSTQTSWGFDPADKGSSVVTWFPGDRELHQRPSTQLLPSGSRFAHLDLSFAVQWTVPQFGSIELEWDERGAGRPVGESGDPFELETIMSLESLLAGDDTVRHRMFGYPDQIQDEMRTECELVTNGIYTGDSSYASDPRRAALEANGAMWQLLLQVDSDERLGTMWGDGGRIYYWIREDALRDRAFDRVWLVFQCM
jgi:uncharacterized protein YwqG